MTTQADQVADAVRAVLEAARAWFHPGRFTNDPEEAMLAVVVRDMLALMPPWDAVTEAPLPWSEVLAGDETQGADGNWYRVVSVHGKRGQFISPLPPGPETSGTVAVEIDVRGTVRRYTKAGDVMVPVRRKASPEASAVALLRQAGFDLTTLTSRS